MADIQYSSEYSSDYGYEDGGAQAAPLTDTSRVTQMVNWAGALVSMGLVIGMGVWAFQLLVRDVADVPVIRALEGPMRIQPEDPGGAVAENQGLAVNRLAEGAEAAPVPDELRIAPPPIDLAEVAPLVQAAEPQVEVVPEEAFENASVAANAPEAPLEATTAEDTTALIERLLEEAQPLDAIDGETADVQAPDVSPGFEIIPASVPGVSSSPRPATRPANLSVVRTSAAVEPVPSADQVTEDDNGFEIASAELETGTRLVQLGAFDTADLARTEWARLAQVYPDFFLGRARVIEEASSGGQEFYRLRAHGFADLSASRRFCAAMVAQGAACIPVTVR